MRLIRFPKFIPLAQYEVAIHSMVCWLRKQNGVEAIYQIGSVSKPGISDIDILAVFADNATCKLNPRSGLPKSEQYLFSHQLYGAVKRDFLEAQDCTFFHNYKLLWGKDLVRDHSPPPCSATRELQTQIALEYLVRMYIDLSVKRTYGIMYVTGLLRHAKALLYDLDFLDCTKGPFLHQLQILLRWRDNWFTQQPSQKQLKEWIDRFYEELTSFLGDLLNRKSFYVPGAIHIRIAPSITLVPAEHMGFTHRGKRLPSFLAGLGRRYFNIQHRFNRFEFHIPMAFKNIPDSVQRRFRVLRAMKKENQERLPHFMPMGSSLRLETTISDGCH